MKNLTTEDTEGTEFKKSDGGPAFPQVNYAKPADGYGVSIMEIRGGMSLRDWFAGMALQHIPELLHANLVNKSYENIAQWSYQVADAMLREREEQEGGK